jgi:uncharacterized protein (DUF1919 family)
MNLVCPNNFVNLRLNQTDFAFWLQNISAYLGKELMSTFVRGNLVFAEGKYEGAACGVRILAK